MSFIKRVKMEYIFNIYISHLRRNNDQSANFKNVGKMSLNFIKFLKPQNDDNTI